MLLFAFAPTGLAVGLATIDSVGGRYSRGRYCPGGRFAPGRRTGVRLHWVPRPPSHWARTVRRIDHDADRLPDLPARTHRSRSCAVAGPLARERKRRTRADPRLLLTRESGALPSEIVAPVLIEKQQATAALSLPPHDGMSRAASARVEIAPSRASRSCAFTAATTALEAS